MYYDFSKINAYPCPIKIVISRRGLGKTFSKLRSYVERCILSEKRFVYVVETGEMVKELCRNNGDKFWSALLEYYSKKDTARKRFYHSLLNDTSVTDDGADELFTEAAKTKLIGGVIRVAKKTLGYIVDMNAFGEIKRNNFTKTNYILVDEFISEKLDKTSLENPKKISSIVQSIARLNNIEISMLGNAIRKDDPILRRMGFKLEKYGFYKKYDECGLVAILHFVDPKDYPEFEAAHNKSVAGRFARLMGETNEEENRFISDIPEDRKLRTFKFRRGGFSANIIRDDVKLSLREIQGGKIACLPFLNKTCKTLLCLTEKEQGYKDGMHIVCNKALRQTLMNMLRADIIYYYSEIEYNQLKIIIKGE